jgi:type VI secretion system protein ImpH
MTLLDRVAAQPYAFDFFYALRHVEATHSRQPRLGEAARPADEPVRLGQEPLLDFAPAAISGVQEAKEFRPPVVQMRFFGLLGPNGALPLHLTEHARDRLLHHGDATFARFLDIFNHRFGLLFYRAWSQAQPVTSLDRPTDDRFAVYVGSLFGLGLNAARKRDAAEDEIKLHHAGSLARQARNADGLRALVSRYFRLPIRVEEFVARCRLLIARGWAAATREVNLGAGRCSAPPYGTRKAAFDYMSAVARSPSMKAFCRAVRPPSGWWRCCALI